jgi:hypothetical protein
MKPLTATLAFVLFIFSASAQVIPIRNSLQNDIAKVISDYPNGFRNISGDEVMDNPQSVEFESKIELKEAKKCRVFKYSSNTKDVYSWEAEMLKTDDFDEVSKRFKAIYNSIQHLSVNINDNNVVFKADYIKPTEEIRFTTIVFDADNKNFQLNKLKIALVLEAEMLEWVIKIQVYEKEREDKDRGRQID